MSDIEKLEFKLQNEKDHRQRLIMLNQLTDYYTYTNVQRAQTLLAELKIALNYHPNQDILQNYYINSALVENQLYNHKLAGNFIREALKLTEEMGSASQQMNVYIDYAGVLMNLGQHEEVQIYLDKASSILEMYPDKRTHAQILCRSGFLQLHYNKQDLAIDFLTQAERAYNDIEQDLTLKDYYFLTLIHSGLGNIYTLTQDFKKSSAEYLKVVSICEAKGIKTRLSWHYVNLGKSLLSEEDYINARTYLKKAIHIPEDISRSPRAGAMLNLGISYFMEGNYTEAMLYYQRSEMLYQESKKDKFKPLAMIERRKVELYKELGKRDEREEHLLKAWEYAERSEDLKEMSVTLRDISDYYGEYEDFENAYVYQKMYTRFAFENVNHINSERIKELQVKYEVDKRQREAELLQLQATKLQLKALRAQMNPHFMHNALNSIQHYIMKNEAQTASQFLARFAKLMRATLEYSELESISIEREIEFLEDYLQINQKLRFDNLSFSIKTSNEIEEDIMNIPTMIVQPYIENAIEHGLRTVENGNVQVYFSLLDDKTILCEVTDNGIGRQKSQELQEEDNEYGNHQSRGTSITEKRLELLQLSHNFENLKVSYDDLKNSKTGVSEGTKVLIHMPIVETILK